MSDYLLNGKNVEDGLECPACGGTLDAHRMEVQHEPEMFSIRGDLRHYVEGPTTMSLHLVCGKCYTKVDIESPCDTLECVEATEPNQWGYVIMGITSVKYGRVKNLGNYETERFEAEVIVEDQSPEEAVAECKAFVKKQLGLGPTAEELDEARDLLREAGEL